MSQSQLPKPQSAQGAKPAHMRKAGAGQSAGGLQRCRWVFLP